MAANAAKAAVNRAIPKGTFERLGAQTGARLGRGLANITGMGDYALNSTFTNNNYNAMMKRGSPSQTVSSREFVKDWTFDGNPDFTLETFSVNPADSKLFPWLSKLATLYTKYRFKQLVLEFVSSSSDYSASISLGTMIFAPQYNIKADVFDTKQTMEAATHAVSFKPSKNAMCGIECDPKDSNYKWYFVRNRGSSVIDVTTDFVRLSVANVGTPASVPAGTTLGELWINYTVELIEPLLSAGNSPAMCTATILNPTGVNALSYGAFGLANFTPTSLAGYNYVPFTYFTEQPSVSKYRVGINKGINDSVIWFKDPGYYTVVVSATLDVALTAFPSQPWASRLNNADVWSGDALLLQSASQPWAISNDRRFVSSTYVIQANSSDCGIRFLSNADYSGIALCDPSKIDIVITRSSTF